MQLAGTLSFPVKNFNPVVQTADYNPFGAQMASSFGRVTNFKNNYLYQGEETPLLPK